MDIYLVRHADAADRAVDPERHLTDRGRRDAAALAEALRPLRLRVHAIWHSGKPRAAQTAELVAPAIACGTEHLVGHSGLKPFAPVKKLARTLCQTDQSIMIVGHEPFLGRLAARLVTGRAKTPMLSLAKPAVACLRRDECGEWRLAWMLSPDVVGQRPRDDETGSGDARSVEMESASTAAPDPSQPHWG